MSGPVQRLQSKEDFSRGMREYHDPSLPGDTITYLYVLNATESMRRSPTPPRRNEVRLLLSGYLRSWGGMARVLGSTDTPEEGDTVLDSLVRNLDVVWDQIASLREASIWSVESSLPAIRSLFDAVWTDLKGPTRQTSAGVRSPVSTGKLLHILLPNVCIIWDNENVIEPGLATASGIALHPTADGAGYVSYLREKSAQVRDLAAKEHLEPAVLAAEAKQEHARGLEQLFPGLGIPYLEPLTKLLDEVNYLRG